MEREGAEMGALLTLHEPTAAMKREALAAGVYTSPGWNRTYPRLQIVTVDDLLNERGIAYPPPAQTNVTHKKAARARSAVGGQTFPLPEVGRQTTSQPVGSPLQLTVGEAMQNSLFEMPAIPGSELPKLKRQATRRPRP